MSRAAPFAELRDADAILNFIFDPHKSFIGATLPGLPTAPSVSTSGTSAGTASTATTACAEDATEARLSASEKRAVDAAEAGDAGKAVSSLTEVIAEAPQRASAYNNRAQAYRLLGDSAAARSDLDTAIRLGHEWLDAHKDGATPQHAAHRTVLQSAYTQRAILLHQGGDQEAADKDLHAAAAFGGQLARMMTTGTNPYAALCNTAIAKMLEGQGDAEATTGTAGSAGAATAACVAATSTTAAAPAPSS